MRARFVPHVAAVVALAAAPSAARAQAGGKALAEALFQDGRTLLAAGQTHEACTKFAMSQRIEPKLGTLLNLASCHEKEGKTASAWAEFTEAIPVATRSDQQDREAFAREHAQALAPRLSRISISTSQLDELTVQIDGVQVDRAVLGTAFPVDPGAHTLVVSAPGKKSWSQGMTIPEGPALTPVSVPVLLNEGAAPPSVAPRPPPASTAAPAPQPDVPTGPPPPPRSRVPALIAFGAGGVAVATGTFFGIRALDRKGDADGHCPTTDQSGAALCDDVGETAYEDAEIAATASTVAFGVGLVAIGIGVYLMVRPPARAATTARARSVTRFAPSPSGFRLVF